MSRGLALLPLGLLLLAVTEIAVFVAVVHAVGGLWAILALAVSSLAGLALLRREGVRGWRAFRAAAEAGRPPGPQVSNSLVGLLGALLLAVPGYLSAVAGLILLVPPGRLLARRGVERFTERRVGAAVAGDLFGPRRVKVRRGDPVDVVPETPVQRDPVRRGPVAAIEGEVVEGEVIR
ncbi:FxsA family protein [Micromonosporaceae bacterium Da 78-11]